MGRLLLLTRRVRRDRLVVAVMFAGLFIIVTGADSSLLGGGVIAAAGRLQLDRLPVLSALTAILANLIVVQRAAAGGVVIGVWDYCRVGVPLTLLTLLIGTLWLSL